MTDRGYGSWITRQALRNGQRTALTDDVGGSRTALRSGISGGAPCPLTVITALREAGMEFTEGFGMTETAPIAACLQPEDVVAHAGSIGRPAQFNDFRILNDEGEQVPLGEVGKLCVRGPNVFIGYWNKPDETGDPKGTTLTHRSIIRPSTSPSDLQGMLTAVAVVTGRGGPVSHAAVVARGLDRPAVCGIGAIEVAADRRSAVVAGHKVNKGTEVSVDGDQGLLFLDAHEIATDTIDPYLDQIRSWGG